VYKNQEEATEQEEESCDPHGATNFRKCWKQTYRRQQFLFCPI